MSHGIAVISGMEILDSRGYPTLRVFVELEDGTRASASVPAGASTGRHEAIESRDGPHSADDLKRYGGRGVRHAVAAVEGEIAQAFVHMDATQQAEIDQKLIDLDGTHNKSRLGANASSASRWRWLGRPLGRLSRSGRWAGPSSSTSAIPRSGRRRSRRS